MGWTHYWNSPDELDVPTFARAVSDSRRVLEASLVALAGADGTGRPTLTHEAIIFNSVASSGCEPFVSLRRTQGHHLRRRPWQFCKTEHLPYDRCVMAVLVVLQHHFGSRVTVASDGRETDWRPATELCRTVLGYDSGFTLAPRG
jgi:hypothetical protein